MRLPHFSRLQIIQLGRLLNMKYTPAEIAKEIGVSSDTVTRSYLPYGCPHEREKSGRVWINGAAFRTWVMKVIGEKKRKGQPMVEGEGWCMKCNARVMMVDPKPIWSNRSLEILQGTCPNCGCKVNRGRSSGKGA